MISATGLPNRVTRTDRRVRRTLSKMPRQVALNFEIEISSIMHFYTMVNKPWSNPMVATEALHTPRLVETVVSILLGNGDGSFASPISFEAGRGPTSVAVADLNGGP